MAEGRTRHDADFSAYLEQTYGDRLLTVIPRRVVLRDALADVRRSVGSSVRSQAPVRPAATFAIRRSGAGSRSK
jgi:hypothetical protein